MTAHQQLDDAYRQVVQVATGHRGWGTTPEIESAAARFKQAWTESSSDARAEWERAHPEFFMNPIPDSVDPAVAYEISAAIWSAGQPSGPPEEMGVS